MVSSIFLLFQVGSACTNGFSDAFDDCSQKVEYPVLSPSLPDPTSPSSTGSDNSFVLSPSLLTMIYSPRVIGVGTAVETRKISVIAKQVAVPKMSDLLSVDQSSSTPKRTEPRNSARRLPTKAQITAIRNGSPVSRQLPKSKLGPCQGSGFNSPYGSFKRVQQRKDSTKQDVKPVDNVFRTASADIPDKYSPQRVEDRTRRFEDYGIGPVVRYAKDAHQMIMGEQSS